MNKNFPLKLQTLVCKKKYSNGNYFLHEFVRDNSHPYESVDEHFIRYVLQIMPGIATNQLSDEGWTALHLAVLQNDYLMVRQMLAYLKAINVNKTSLCLQNDGTTSLPRKETALHTAVSLDCMALTRERLENRREENRDSNSIEKSVKDNNFRIAKLLVENGADVNATDNEGCTPLHYAVKCHKGKLVKFLLDNESLVIATDNDNRRPLHYAVINNNYSIVKLFVKSYPDSIKTYPPLLCPVETSNTKIVRLFQRHGYLTKELFTKQHIVMI